MACGFGTKGAAGTDSVELPFAAHATQRTYAFWVYRDGAGGGSFGRIFDKRVSGAEVELAALDSAAGRIAYIRDWSGGQGSWAIANDPNAVWAHVVITYDAGSSANVPVMYYNGVSQAIITGSSPAGAVLTNADDYVLGNRKTDNARNLDGMLAEFGIWNRILTQGEITALANGWSPLAFRSSFVAYAPFIGGAGVDRLNGPPTVTGTLPQPHIRSLYPQSRGRHGKHAPILFLQGAALGSNPAMRVSTATLTIPATRLGDTLIVGSSSVDDVTLSPFRNPMVVVSILAGGVTPLTFLGAIHNGKSRQELWVLQNVAAGITSLVFTWDVAGWGVMESSEYRADTLAIGQVVTASGASSNPTATITTQDPANVVAMGSVFARNIVTQSTVALNGVFREGAVVSGADVGVDGWGTMIDNASETPAAVTCTLLDPDIGVWSAVAVELRTVALTGSYSPALWMRRRRRQFHHRML